MNYVLTEVKASPSGKIEGIKINNKEVDLHAPMYDGLFEILSEKKGTVQVICPAALNDTTIIAVIKDGKSVSAEAVKVSKNLCSVKGKGKISFYNDFAKVEDGKFTDIKDCPIQLGAIEL